MGLTKAQETDVKNLSKEVLKECLADKDFIETFTSKFIDVATKTICKAIEDQIKNLDDKITHVNNENETLKNKYEILSSKYNCLEEKFNQLNIQSDINNSLNMKLDYLEQQSKLQQLRIFGVPEQTQENVPETVLKILRDKLGVTICKLDYCHRLGLHDKKNKNNRPILVKFNTMEDRNIVFYNKKKLKGHKIVITEELTKFRYQLLNTAISKTSKSEVWSNQGHIFLKHNGKKHKVKSEEDLENILLKT